jgi:hypothetical protein
MSDAEALRAMGATGSPRSPTDAITTRQRPMLRLQKLLRGRRRIGTVWRCLTSSSTVEPRQRDSSTGKMSTYSWNCDSLECLS